jgi:hypothetical protein
MKRLLQEICFFLFMSLVWGIALCFVILGPIFYFLDWLVNTELLKIIDVYIIGQGYFGLAVLCIIGIPLAWILRKTH